MPEEPIEIALAERITRPPEEEDTPRPLSNDTPPPAYRVSVVIPAATVKSPPFEESEMPTPRLKEPARALIA